MQEVDLQKMTNCCILCEKPLSFSEEKCCCVKNSSSAPRSGCSPPINRGNLGGGEFATPGLFSNSGTRIPDGRQLTDYGAADREIGLVSVESDKHVRFLKSRNR